MEVNYIGEWLLTGNMGHLLTIINMVAAFLAMFSYYKATQAQTRNELALSQSWKSLARKGFWINFLSIVGIFVILFVLIFYHRFEFKYVWQHSSTTLPVYYMISCFWEGQEGSFLLWQFWIAFLGLIVMRTAKKWEAPVLAVVSVSQVFLAAMLIGIHFFGYKIGSSPFLLMRESDISAPIFMRANYLEFLVEGNGLNPLLQNYWMVIHPPTLFLGFAATIIPFAYVMAALWKKDFTDWVAPTLSWSLFAGGVLGTGILMGGAWAYEALSFGGFWAWDPVENASLVPWIVLVAGIHTLVAYKHSGHALRATTILLSLSYLLILYSSFLTRSGILGDSSVHAFTDLGMSGQLLSFLFAFIGISVFVIGKNWNTMPAPKKEEAVSSREFWMFIGAIVMLMLAGLITLDTSWPVINKVFGTNVAITEPVSHYNNYTIWFAIVIAFFSATLQYFRYKKTKFVKTEKQNAVQFLGGLLKSKMLLPIAILSLIAASALAFFGELLTISYVILLFMAVFSVLANLNYIITGLSGKIKTAGGSIAHVGFGLILIGVLFSFGKTDVLSVNTMGIDYGEQFDEQNNKENVLIYKGKPIQMGEYWVTYEKDSLDDPNHYYQVKYERKKNLRDQSEETFTLYPNAQINPKMGLIANPDTKHYWTKDIFTHVSSVTDKEKKGQELKEIELSKGDTIITNSSFVILKEINPNPMAVDYIPAPGDIAAGAQIEIVDISNNKYNVEPIYYIRNNMENHIESYIPELNMNIKFEKIIPDQNKIKISVIEPDAADFIIMKALIFPYINVLWLGCFVSVIGFFISMKYRWEQGKRAWSRKASKVERELVKEASKES